MNTKFRCLTSEWLRYAVACIFITCCFPVHSSADGIDSLKKEAASGSKRSIYNLGVKYDSGEEISEDKGMAFSLYKISARMNYAPAQNNLGWFYRQGIATQANPAAAVYWFGLSALQGNALALQNLAEMFISGEGVPKNLKYAENFYTLCATKKIGVSDDRESGFNNAIHECRREVGNIWALQNFSEGQKKYRYAAVWLAASLVEHEEEKEDSEFGVRARKSKKKTKELLMKVKKELDADSRKWVNGVLENWDEFRDMMEDVTPFPLGIFQLIRDERL